MRQKAWKKLCVLLLLFILFILIFFVFHDMVVSNIEFHVHRQPGQAMAEVSLH